MVGYKVSHTELESDATAFFVINVLSYFSNLGNTTFYALWLRRAGMTKVERGAVYVSVAASSTAGSIVHLYIVELLACTNNDEVHALSKCTFNCQARSRSAQYDNNNVHPSVSTYYLVLAKKLLQDRYQERVTPT
eukprot:6188447-Pleurochrysis_carterae.AAC.4